MRISRDFADSPAPHDTEQGIFGHQLHAAEVVEGSPNVGRAGIIS